MLIFSLMAPSIQAADSDEVAPDVSLPNLEFLEFLGQWETDEGEWIAPEQLIDGDIAQLLDAAALEVPLQATDENDDDDNDDNQGND